MAIFLFFAFMILIVLGVPVAFALGISTAISLIIFSDVPLIVVSQRIITSFDSFTLSAVPLFILVGRIMSQGGIAQKLIRLANALVGHIRGSLAHVNIVASLFFGSISGSVLADTSAIGGIMIPAMVKEKFDRAFAVIVTACSSPLSAIIPPSILMIIYGWLTETSVPALFAGGFIPGLLIAFALLLLSFFYARKRNYPVKKRADFRELLNAFKEAFPPLMMPVIILGGILFGIFTPTEAAAIAVVFGIILTGFVYRTLNFNDFVNCLVDSAVISAAVMLIFGMAAGFAWLLTSAQVPLKISKFIVAIAPNKHIFILYVMILYIVVGLFLTPTPAMIIFIPILLPSIINYGIDLVHFGMIMVFNLSIGLLTPPVGACLYTACMVGETSVRRVLRPFIPFLGVIILVMVIIAYAPVLTLAVPKWLGLIR